MTFASHDPATGEVVWEGSASSAEEVAGAARAARDAFESWADISVDERIALLRRYQQVVTSRRDDIATAISRETGKPLWESRGEADLLKSKVDVSIEVYGDRCATKAISVGHSVGETHYRPNGVMAVLGPFNFPVHVPNGHIVPALLAGNTVIFKPSEMTPMTGGLLIACFQETGFADGVVNIVQDGREVGEALVSDVNIDGVLLTGSYAAGQAIGRALADHPEKLIALEMGGNNALVVYEASDIDAAAYVAIQSAFLTAGQRCTCARRIILVDGEEAEAFIERFAMWTKRIRVGRYTDRPEPFMGPVISATAATRLMDAVGRLVSRGARAIVPMKQTGPAMLSPAILDVTDMADRPDEELFGPVAQIIRVADFDSAITEANRTRYGLSASLLSDKRDNFEVFRRRVRAGIINWNHQTTGASSKLPFGGTGLSGNHRPTGAAAADYCSHPVASLQSPSLALPAQLTPGLNS